MVSCGYLQCIIVSVAYKSSDPGPVIAFGSYFLFFKVRMLCSSLAGCRERVNEKVLVRYLEWSLVYSECSIGRANGMLERLKRGCC